MFHKLLKTLFAVGLVNISFIGSTFATTSSDEVNFHHYTKNFNGGYCYRFEIRHTGTEKLEDWYIQFKTDANIYKHYSGKLEDNGNVHTFTSLSWNEKLKSNKTYSLGFCARGTAKPTDVVFSHKGSIATDTILFEDTFTPYWEQDWNLQDKRRWGFENFEYLDGDILRVKYPAGSYKPSGEIRGGGGFIRPIDSTSIDLYFSYDVLFEDGFDFVKGGKLPGLCGNNCPTGGALREEGFSARMMWRPLSALEIYGYFADPNTEVDGIGGSYGKITDLLKIGRWHTIQQRIKLNTLGNSDGVIEYWLDGEKIFSKSGVYIVRDAYKQKWGILFSTFFGGGDKSWATPIDAYTQFRNFKVWEKN